MATIYQPGTGLLSNLTDKQKTILQEFKEKLNIEGIQSHRINDSYLLYFLRARKFELEAATQLLIDSEKWKEEIKLDELCKTFEMPNKQKIKEEFPKYYHHCDKEGRPIEVRVMGAGGVSGFSELIGQDDKDAKTRIKMAEELITKDLIVGLETLIQHKLPCASKEKGSPVEQQTVILDLANFSVKNAYNEMTFHQEINSVCEKYFPEVMGKLFVINAPFIFSAFFSAMKAFLDPVTASKISVLGYSSTLR